MTTSTRDRIFGAFAIIAYMGVGVLPYLPSGLVVPVAVVPVLWGAWAVGLVVCVRLVRRNSIWALAAAPAALLFWVLFVQTGSLLFGWSA